MPAPDDTPQLLERYARHGDERAFAELVRRHAALAAAGQRADVAEDAAQLVFIQLARQAGRRARTSLEPWLRVATLGTVRKLLRGERRRRHREVAVASTHDDGTGATEKISAEEVGALLSHLVPRDRELLVWRVIEGLTFPEIASAQVRVRTPSASASPALWLACGGSRHAIQTPKRLRHVIRSLKCSCSFQRTVRAHGQRKHLHNADLRWATSSPSPVPAFCLFWLVWWRAAWRHWQ